MERRDEAGGRWKGLALALLAAHVVVLGAGLIAWRTGMVAALVLGGTQALLVTLLCGVHWLRSRASAPQTRTVEECNALELGHRAPHTEEELAPKQLAARLETMLGEHARRASEVHRLTRELKDLRQAAREAMTLPTPALTSLALRAVPQAERDCARGGYCQAGRPPSSGCVRQVEFLGHPSPVEAASPVEVRTGRELVAVEREEAAGGGETEKVVFAMRGRMSSRVRVLLHKLGNRVRDTSSLRRVQDAWKRKRPEPN